MAAPSLSKHSIVGFSIQSAYDTPNTANIRWVPFAAGSLTFGQAGTNQLFEQSNRADWPTEVIADGDFASGDIPMIFRPDTNTLTDLVDWVQTRDVYNQCKWATVYIVERVDGTDRVEAWQDVKIQRMTISVQGGQAAEVSLTCVGRKEYTGHGVSAPANTDYGAPLIWSGAAITASWDAGSYVADVDFEQVTFVYETNADDPLNGHRIAGSLNPTRIWNTGGERVSIDTTRDFVDLTYKTAFDSHLRSGPDAGVYDLGLKLVLTGTAVLTITCPRISIQSHPRSMQGGTNVRNTEDITFDALGSADGSTRPATMVVS